MHDPDLTELGKEQCASLNAKFPYHNSVELLTCSPLRRTLYTTLLGFKGEISKGIKTVAIPDAQELSDLPCDTGSDPAVLLKEFAENNVDFGLLKEGWNNNVRDAVASLVLGLRTLRKVADNLSLCSVVAMPQLKKPLPPERKLQGSG
jgi:hypothetical protein